MRCGRLEIVYILFGKPAICNYIPIFHFIIFVSRIYHLGLYEQWVWKQMTPILAVKAASLLLLSNKTYIYAKFCSSGILLLTSINNNPAVWSISWLISNRVHVIDSRNLQKLVSEKFLTLTTENILKDRSHATGEEDWAIDTNSNLTN